MTLKKCKETYILESPKGEFKIYIKKYVSGRLSVLPWMDGQRFRFENSDPELVEIIGKLIVEASKIKFNK